MLFTPIQKSPEFAAIVTVQQPLRANRLIGFVNLISILLLLLHEYVHTQTQCTFFEDEDSQSGSRECFLRRGELGDTGLSGTAGLNLSMVAEKFLEETSGELLVVILYSTTTLI